MIDLRSAEHIMGTAIWIHVSAGTGAGPAVDEAVDHLRWVESTFSTFRADSQITRINDGHLEIADADRRVGEVLLRCSGLRLATREAFDHVHDGRLDPAGFVKGWAVDGAAEILRAAGFEDFLIWAGGDIAAAGHPPDAAAWSIGIRDPFDANNALAAIQLTDRAIATTGCYERGDHIRGDVPGGLASVSVVGPELGVADALATAAFAGGLSRIEWFSDFADYELIAVTEDRRLLRSSPRRSAEARSVTPIA